MDYSDLQKQYDTINMDVLIERFIEDFEKAWEIGQKLELPAGFKGAKHVIGTGMGGSGMGYTLLLSLARSFGTASIEVVSDYALPPYATANSGIVVCATSFSGNTEETLDVARQALERKLPMIAITTGGKLAPWAKEHNIPVAVFDYPVPLPRVGLPYTFGVAFSVLTQAGIVQPEDVPSALSQLKQHMNSDAMRKLGQEIAEQVQGKMIYCIGPGFAFPVATRWKGQFNENSKNIAFAELMPEMCHNMYLGYKQPDHIRTNSAVIFLDSKHDHPQNRKRNQLVMEDFAKDGVTVVRPSWPDELGPISTLLAQLVVGDWASYYLALLNHVDPSDTSRIEDLKKRL